MRIDLRPWLGVSIGRSDYLSLPAEVFIGIGWHSSPDETVECWGRWWSVSWSWLPRLHWYDTGHKRILYSWSWPFRFRRG